MVAKTAEGEKEEKRATALEIELPLCQGSHRKAISKKKITTGTSKTVTGSTDTQAKLKQKPTKYVLRLTPHDRWKLTVWFGDSWQGRRS